MKNGALDNLIAELKQIQADFYKQFGVTDIITNSKIFEILIADSLNHILIPGHSGSRDAKDSDGGEFEYKHYKESSSNHTWTFNDFSDTTIKKLNNVKAVIFAHINDINLTLPKFDWYYEVPGEVMSKYLAQSTLKIRNSRKMINVSSKQIELLGIKKKPNDVVVDGHYASWVKRIVEVVIKIEEQVGTKGILTSNKFWEVVVALKLGHKVESEQAKHDATDEFGNAYEYKVAKNHTWSFQDISKVVLNKYLSDKSIILAVVDKDEFLVKNIYEAEPKKVVTLLRKKLLLKKKRYATSGREVRRKQISLSSADLKRLKAKTIYKLE